MVRTSRKPTPKRQRPAGSVRSFFISIGTLARLRQSPAVLKLMAEAIARAAARSAARGVTRAVPKSNLYPCQRAGITACLRALRRGFTRLGISSPTGSGKTTTFINLLPKIPLREVGNQVLILVPTVTIANQVATQIRMIHGRLYVVEKEYDGHHDTQTPGAPSDVTVATYQSLSGQSASHLEKYKPELFRCVIVDESHHSASDSYLEILHHFNDGVLLNERLSAKPGYLHGHRVPIIGFSATFTRTDKRALGWIYEKVVLHTKVEELLRQLLLSRVDICSFKEKTVLAWNAMILKGQTEKTQQIADEETGNGNETTTTELPTRKMNSGKFAKCPEFANHVVDIFRQKAALRRSTLVFCIDRAAVQQVTKAFEEAKIGVRSVDGDTPPEDRTSIIADFNAAKFKVLVNCQVFTEGADMPAIDTIILANPTKSSIRMVQMVGRGRRVSPGTKKTKCVIIDRFGILETGGLSVEPDLWQEGCYDVPPDNVMV